MLSQVDFIACDFVTNVKRFLQGDWSHAVQIVKCWVGKKPDQVAVAQIKPELTAALAAGSPDALVMQGIMFYCKLEEVQDAKQHNYLDEALVYLRKAAACNKVMALHLLSFLYERGSIRDLNCVELAACYEKIGHNEKLHVSERASAANDLGRFYTYGFGVVQDYVKAKEYYTLAAALGEIRALSNLGVLYENGFGVDQDYVRAKKYYEGAAHFGETHALDRLGVLYEHGLGVEQDCAMARDYYTAAARLGNASGFTHLGFLYEKGLGVAKEFVVAERCYYQAVDLGDTYAAARLREAYSYIAAWHGSFITVRLNTFILDTEARRQRNRLSARILGENFCDVNMENSRFLLAHANNPQLRVFLQLFQITNYLWSRSKQDAGYDYQIRMNDFWHLIHCGLRSKSDFEEYVADHRWVWRFLHSNTYRNLRNELSKETATTSAESFARAVQLFRQYLQVVVTRNLAPPDQEMLQKLLDYKTEPYVIEPPLHVAANTKKGFFSSRRATILMEETELKSGANCS